MMCDDARDNYGCIDMRKGPLMRLVMESDRVSDHEMMALMERVRWALLSDRRETTRGDKQRCQRVIASAPGRTAHSL